MEEETLLPTMRLDGGPGSLVSRQFTGQGSEDIDDKSGNARSNRSHVRTWREIGGKMTPRRGRRGKRQRRGLRQRPEYLTLDVDQNSSDGDNYGANYGVDFISSVPRTIDGTFPAAFVG